MASADSSLLSHESGDHKNKSPNALRTISEASDLLDVPQHVLRFWETKFTQIKPLKRNGGRRFYRPQDLDILQQIKHLLYNQGYTIKGARKAVDEFIHARAAVASVKTSEWIAAIPAASVNDNHAVEEPDMLAELAQALAAPEPEQQAEAPASFPREALLAMRKELIGSRDTLRCHLDNATPVAA